MHEQRITVGLRLRHLRGADGAAGAGAVLDDGGLAELRGEFFGDRARHDARRTAPVQLSIYPVFRTFFPPERMTRRPAAHFELRTGCHEALAGITRTSLMRIRSLEPSASITQISAVPRRLVSTAAWCRPATKRDCRSMQEPAFW